MELNYAQHKTGKRGAENESGHGYNYDKFVVRSRRMDGYAKQGRVMDTNLLVVLVFVVGWILGFGAGTAINED